MNFCPNCGEKVTQGVNFCPACGHALTQTNSPTENTIATKATTPLAATTQTDKAETTKDSKPNVNPKLPLLVLATLVIITGLLYLAFTVLGQGKEVTWQTSQLDDNPFAVTLTRRRDDFTATVATSPNSSNNMFDSYMSFQLAGQMVETDLDRTEHLQVEDIIFELDTSYLQTLYEDTVYLFESMTDSSPSEALPLSWIDLSLKEKKDHLKGVVSEAYSYLGEDQAEYFSDDELAALNTFENLTLKFIDSAYETDSGIGMKLAMKDAKEMLQALGKTEPNTSSATSMFLTILENNLMFEQVDDSTARFDIPFVNQTVFFYKEVN